MLIPHFYESMFTFFRFIISDSPSPPNPLFRAYILICHYLFIYRSFDNKGRMWNLFDLIMYVCMRVLYVIMCEIRVCVYTYSIQYSFVCICIDDTYLTWLKIRSLPKDVSKFLMRWATLTLLDGSERGNLIRYDATEEWEETETNHYVRIWILSEFCHLPTRQIPPPFPPLFSFFLLSLMWYAYAHNDDGRTRWRGHVGTFNHPSLSIS